MRKFLLATLSVLCAGFATLGVACKDTTDKDNNDGNSDIVVLNGFNHWDDMVIIYLDPATFDGSMKLNKDTTYIAEGNASYKCYIGATMANQPELKLTASGRKNDITDVSQFGLYIYNANDYAFDVIVTAYAGDKVACAPYATAEPGANNLTFDVNRAMIQNTGKVITEYSIAFSGVRADATFYIDNFYLKTTKDEVVITEKAKAVIGDITALPNDATRQTLETVMDKYNALTTAEKQTIANYDRLETLMKPFWLADLSAVRAQDDSKLLYFDVPFAGVQISSKTAGVGSYGYSTEKSYGEESGSLKVDFSVSPTNWVNIATTATAQIDEEYIEFYVYNDSDQYKAMCVGWNVPINAEYPAYMELAPNAWTQVWAKAEHLTNSGKSSGVFEVCGLSDLTDRRASAPKGSLYFSSVTKIRPSQVAQAVIDEINALPETATKTQLESVMANYQALAVADKQAVNNYDKLKGLLSTYWSADITAAQTNDPDTLLYFDETFGAGQITKVDNGIASYGYSTEKKYGNQNGSLKVDFTEKAPGFMPVKGWMNIYTTATTDIEEDYLEFYVYNDSDQYKGIALGWIDPSNSGYGYMILTPNEWTKVFCKSSDLTTGMATKDKPPQYPYGGRIQIVAINDLVNRSVREPEGALYFSAVQKYDPSAKVQAARTGADVNTLFFFDRELGIMQAAASCGSTSYSANTLFDGKGGALKVSFTGEQDESKDAPILSLLTCDYQFNEGDYVVFNVKADIDAKYLEVRFGTKYGTQCVAGKWTQVIIPASAVQEATTPLLRFYANNEGENYWSQYVKTNVKGDVYITQAKVLSADKVKNLAEAETTDTYNIGQTTFVGKMDYYGTKGTYLYNNEVYASFYDTNVALVGDTVRFYARSLHPQNTALNGVADKTVHTAIGMELAEASDKDKMYIVASGLVFEEMYVQCFTARESGHYATAQGANNNLTYEVLEDGYVRYCLDLSSYNSAIKYFRLWTGQKLQMMDVEAVHIRDVYFGD